MHHRFFSYYFAKIEAAPDDSLLIEKTMTLHNVIIRVKSVLNKDKNHLWDIFRKMLLSID